MLERARSYLGRALGLRARYAPPVMLRGSEGPGLSAALRGFLEDDPARYERFFIAGRPIRTHAAEQRPLATFEASGLASRLVGSFWMPCVRVIPFEGLFVCADLATHHDPDQVFAPMFEQTYVARNLVVGAEEEVLELGVGSGVLSLVAARVGARVTAVDLHDRALAFAKFNLALNGLTDSIELKQGSLFAPVEADRRFDLVLTNPPFEPVPPGVTYYHHSAGGPDGLDVVREILRDASSYLGADGRFAISTWSPGTPEHSLLEVMLPEAFPSHEIVLDELEVSPLEPLLERFARAEGYAAWRQSFVDRGLTHLHDLFALVVPAATPSLCRRPSVATPEGEEPTRSL